MPPFVLDAMAPVSKHLWIYSNGNSLHLEVGFREAERLTHGGTASKCQSQDVNSRLPDSRACE